MMVEMVDPDFTDTIFDPACGTAGFLFDAYEHVIEKAKKTRQFPAEHIANQFYRTGIGGVEYQGRIRKMAAVNMYIRGLNPHNIEQGDSLKTYDPSKDAGSKSIVIANPPFGAERDQPAYPNVWEDYPRESETTILFAKLMFDLLKPGGRCAVVVSEGFLTWGQNSACALRKMLLQEANLKAIISLPQGVFVSKGGQGAKTSILYFEKGEPTDFVWYYKIENDGFSMGTNRKPIDGGQIPEMLNLFKKVKAGKRPEDTKYSFCVSREWIETLDRRVAERIKTEIKEKLEIKNKAKREKLVNQLDGKLAKGGITKLVYEEKLWQFDNVVESQVDNEVAKIIEHAHTYNFNLPNYRSSLSSEQTSVWREVFQNVVIKNGSTTEKRYKELKKADVKTAVSILASFDPDNALQIDIAREFLSNTNFSKDGKFKKLEEILKKGSKYPITSLKNIIIVNEDRIRPASFPDTEFTVLGVSNQTGVFVNEKLRGSEIKQAYFRVSKNQFCYNPYRINVGSIGLNEFDIDNQIISGAYNIFGCKEAELNPKYLDALFKTQKFLDYVISKANGGVRMDFKIEHMQDWEIPLPPIEVQNEIVEKIEQQKQIITGVEMVIKGERESRGIVFEKLEDKLVSVGELFETQYGYTDSANGTGSFRFVRITDIDEDGKLTESEKVYVDILKKQDIAQYKLNNSDLLLVRTGATFGKVLYFESGEQSIFASYLIRLKPINNQLLPKFFWYFTFSKSYWRQAYALVSGGTQPQFNANKIVEVKIPLPRLETQKEIIEKLDNQMRSVSNVQLLKIEAEKEIFTTLAKLWSE